MLGVPGTKAKLEKQFPHPLPDGFFQPSPLALLWAFPGPTIALLHGVFLLGPGSLPAEVPGCFRIRDKIGCGLFITPKAINAHPTVNYCVWTTKVPTPLSTNVASKFPQPLLSVNWVYLTCSPMR